MHQKSVWDVVLSRVFICCSFVVFLRLTGTRCTVSDGKHTKSNATITSASATPTAGLG